MHKNRISRVNDEIMREIAGIIRGELKDPRISSLVTVTKAETTTDLSNCKVYVSIMGDAEQKAEVLNGIKHAGGFIRKLIAERINLRNTPFLEFVLDDSLDYSMKISRLLDEVNRNDN